MAELFQTTKQNISLHIQNIYEELELERGATVKESLTVQQKGIGVSWRWLGNKSDGSARSEIILYDNTPGGAGFVSECESNWQDVVLKAWELSENCNCDSACYDCIKNYYNQTYHEQLDRKGVVEFLSD
jgi:ATP-dependent helicase YprA (DUF1998 family)